jgi:hypothetical protein
VLPTPSPAQRDEARDLAFVKPRLAGSDALSAFEAMRCRLIDFTSTRSFRAQ